MQSYLLNRKGEIPKRLERVEQLPDEGFIWLDFTRGDDARGWQVWAERLAGVHVHDEHVADSMAVEHPSYFDGADDYDMLIFEGLTPESCGESDDLVVTRPAAFFLFDRLLISVHTPENLSFTRIKEKFCETKLRFPSTPFGLVHAILDQMVNRYMSITDELERRLEIAQDALLDPKNPFEDWLPLLRYRKQAHALELLCEQNQETLDDWRRNMRIELTEAQRIRLNDASEHIDRVMSHADQLQKDVEVAVQLHFAAVSHRTNEIMRTLTAVSIVFFPLTLITGIYGMNFENMPELHTRDGYYIVLAALGLIGAALIWWLKRRRIF